MCCPNLDTIWQILEIQLQKQILLHPTRSTGLLDVCLENLHPLNSPKLFLMKAKLVPPSPNTQVIVLVKQFTQEKKAYA